MRINLSIELRRPARRSLALVAGALLLLTPAVVLASHQFPDVTDATPFHKEIGAIAKAGITAGFSDGTYRPSDPVTRQSMAAFMERGFGRVAQEIGMATESPSLEVAGGRGYSDWTAVRKLSMIVPGASSAINPSQLVHLQGRIVFNTSMKTHEPSTDYYCPCEFRAAIVDTTHGGGTPTMSLAGSQTFESKFSDARHFSFDVEALFRVRPGLRTFELLVMLNGRYYTTPAASFVFDAGTSLSAMTFPFYATAE